MGIHKRENDTNVQCSTIEIVFVFRSTYDEPGWGGGHLCRGLHTRGHCQPCEKKQNKIKVLDKKCYALFLKIFFLYNIEFSANICYFLFVFSLEFIFDSKKAIPVPLYLKKI